MARNTAPAPNTLSCPSAIHRRTEGLVMAGQQLSPEEAWQQHRDAIEHGYRFHEGVDVEAIARQTFDEGHADALWYPQEERRK